MGIGIAIVAIGFIAGLVLGKDAYGEFSIAIVFYWWLSALAAGFLFIGLSEIVHLLQKLVDRSAAPAPLQSGQLEPGRMPAAMQTAAETARTQEAIGGYAGSADQGRQHASAEAAIRHGGPARGVVQFKGLTILLDEQKIKGAFRFGPELLQIVSQSMFQADERAQVVATIPLDSFAADYLEDKDYYIFTFEKGTRKLAFKTPNLYDYDPIVKRIRREA